MEMVFQGQILGVVTMSMGVASYPEKGTRLDNSCGLLILLCTRPSRKEEIEWYLVNPFTSTFWQYVE